MAGHSVDTKGALWDPPMVGSSVVQMVDMMVDWTGKRMVATLDAKLVESWATLLAAVMARSLVVMKVREMAVR